MDCDDGEERAIQAQAEEGCLDEPAVPTHNTYQDTLMTAMVVDIVVLKHSQTLL